MVLIPLKQFQSLKKDQSFQTVFFFNFYLLFEDFIYLFPEREREGEKHQYVLASRLGTWPITRAHALIGNQTGDPLVRSPALNPPSHTSQGFQTVFIVSSLLFQSLTKGTHRKLQKIVYHFKIPKFCKFLSANRTEQFIKIGQ